MAGDAISSFAVLVPAKSQLEVSAGSWISRTGHRRPISRPTRSDAGAKRLFRIHAMMQMLTAMAQYSPHSLAKVKGRLMFPTVPIPPLRLVHISSSGSPRATTLLVP